MTIQQTISPVDGSIVAEVMLATDREIDATLDAAVRASRSPSEPRFASGWSTGWSNARTRSAWS
jgi:acyl-CoA reductase-like NAD-dependent aldehyde dehydrogenase